MKALFFDYVKYCQVSHKVRLTAASFFIGLVSFLGIHGLAPDESLFVKVLVAVWLILAFAIACYAERHEWSLDSKS